ncbi:TRAP transporter large permease [Rhodococcus sp. HNM0563]|uniref:TRAP transporter large permease n=1 Tax=unclassified Rhodococcus (in: high G+C Gram-positive bacteria) TaxID=192944 RepID=UPI00146C51C3|nr:MULTISPECIES: TRAP transporter large permease [unclassified Rhodococcus (in: high G+C Gram-positive bacteria)]MCK0090711.1 TRAP transporter large permease [Rhodococcus sp. F64268]NLU61905.1 TRAP transporter large permease [Rhodococcus sp. HNM0563]
MTTTTTAEVRDPNPTPPVVGPSNKFSTRSWVLFGALMVLLLGSTAAIFMPLTPVAIGCASIVMMITLLCLRVPVALTMIVPSFAGLYAMRGERTVTSALTSLPYDEVASWTLSVVPMFVLMGLLLWRSGMTDSLYTAARQWLGWLPGGLAVGTNIAGSGLAAVSGSTTGTTYALGRIGIPEMLKAGYDRRLAVGAVLVAGLPGQLIPPSILLVLYAGIAEVPVGKALLAGIGPGILVSIMFTVAIILIAVFAKDVAGTKESRIEASSVSWSTRFKSLVSIWPIPVLVAVIIGGMFSGLFTATEAGAVAALCSVGVVFIWRRKTGGASRALLDGSIGTVSTVGAVFLLLVGVEALSRMMTLTGISNGFADLITDMNLGRVEFLLLMMVVYLILGAFMDPLPMMVLTVPILIPTLESLDISMLWFGAFVVFMGELAILSPPVGILAMIVHSIVKDPKVNLGKDIPLKDVFVAAAWFLPMAIVVVLILIFFPEISTFLPDRSSGG